MHYLCVIFLLDQHNNKQKMILSVELILHYLMVDNLMYQKIWLIIKMI